MDQDPKTLQVEALRIVPAQVELKPGESQVFEAFFGDKPARGVKWVAHATASGRKKAGGDKVASGTPLTDGVYKAPRRVWRAGRIVVVARQSGTEESQELGRGSATIDLDPGRTWTPIFGTAWIALFGGLLWILFANWTALCPKCAPRGLRIAPPLVTLTSGQAQQFVASAQSTWVNSVNSAGLYTAPLKVDADQMVTVTATSTDDPKQSATGVVKLSRTAGFSIFPGNATVLQGEPVELTAAVMGAAQVTPEWLIPSAGQIEAKGNKAIFRAPNDPKPQTIVVMAQVQVPERPAPGSPPPAPNAPPATSSLLAGALVSVVPKEPDVCDIRAPGAELWGVVLLVALVGALGGLTHAVGSFGTYVGNRELKTSWLWWYGLKPALSAMVAVIIFLVFRAGLGTPTLGLDAANCLTVAGFAGLVGLFAEPATVKLKDIFEVVFTPRRDPREDKAGQTQPKTTTLPEITDVNLRSFKAGEVSTLHVTGKNFVAACAVEFDGALVPTKFVSETAVDAELKAEQATRGKHTIVVVNKPPAGDKSKSFDFDAKLT